MQTQDINLRYFKKYVVSEITKRADSDLPFEAPYKHNQSEVINRDLNRYYLLLKNAFEKAIKQFTSEEISSLLNTLFNAPSAESKAWAYRDELIMRIQEAVEDNIQFPEIDKNMAGILVQKLKSLSNLEAVALHDFSTYFWIDEKRDSLEQAMKNYLA